MEHFAAFLVKDSVCIVDDMGRMEAKGGERTRGAAAGADEPRLPLQAGRAGSRATVAMALLSPKLGLPVICVETRHMKAVLKAQIVMTRRTSARGIAQMMRAGLYRLVHVKTLRSQNLRMYYRKAATVVRRSPSRTTYAALCAT